MKFEIGDRVKLLNDVGTGRVAGIQSNQVLVLLDEDGMELPFYPHELINISKFNQSIAQPVRPKKEEQLKPAAQTKKVKTSPISNTFELSFIPKTEVYFDQVLKNDQQSKKQVVVFYRYDDHFELVYQETLKKNDEINLGSIHITDLNRIDRMLVQWIHLDQTSQESIPGSRLYKISTKKFAVAMQNQKSITFKFNEQEEVKVDQLKITSVDRVVKKKPTSNKVKVPYPRNKWDQFELDLHIESLTESTRGMTNGEIVQTQLFYLQEAIGILSVTKGTELVVIHGIGKGVLKAEVRNYLKGKGIRYEDASYSLYGYGATLALL